MPSRVRVQPRFFIFLALLVVAIILLSWQIFGVKSVEARQDIIGDIKVLPAVIVREEWIHTAENYYHPVYKAAEGDNVQKDALVAQIYNQGLTESSLSDLTSVRDEISQYLSNSLIGDTIDKDLETLNGRVNTILNQIGSVVRGETEGKLLDLERELTAVMAERQEYMRKAARPDPKLQKLLEREQALQNNIDTWKLDIRAEAAGRLSFQFDRYEPIFATSNLERHQPEVYNSFLQNKTEEPASTNNVNNLYRIVNPFLWYVCAVTSDVDWQPSLDSSVHVTFEGYDLDYTSRVKSIMRSEKEKLQLVIFEMNQDIGPLIDIRKVTAQIGNQAQGIKLPAGAIQSVQGMDCVVLSDTKEAVPVRVTARDAVSVLVEPITPGALSVGMRVEVR